VQQTDLARAKLIGTMVHEIHDWRDLFRTTFDSESGFEEETESEQGEQLQRLGQILNRIFGSSV
jgi:hypothetical protein